MPRLDSLMTEINIVTKDNNIIECRFLEDLKLLLREGWVETRLIFLKGFIQISMCIVLLIGNSIEN